MLLFTTEFDLVIVTARTLKNVMFQKDFIPFYPAAYILCSQRGTHHLFCIWIVSYLYFKVLDFRKLKVTETHMRYTTPPSR